MAHISSRARRLTVSRAVAREEGVALVMAIVVVAAVTISTAAMIALTTSNQTAFTRDRLETRAFNTAEAGLNYGIAQLRSFDATGSKAVNSVLGSSTSPIACCDGLGGWWAEKTSPTQWTVSSIGRAPNGDVLRKLSLVTQADTTVTTTAPSLAWASGFFVGSASGCTNMVGTATLTIDVWVKANLCLNGTQQIEEPSASGPQTVEVYVGGTLTINGNARIGSSTRKVLSANIVGGCIKNGPQICSNSSASRVWANSYPTAVSSLTKPPVYPDTTYASGDWDNPTCTTGSFTFDGNSTRDRSVGTFDLFPSSSYTCTVPSTTGVGECGDGTKIGSLAWDASTNTISICGTIFVDGNFQAAGGDKAKYTGFGTIYVGGTVAISGNSTLCGPGAAVSGSTCSGLWDGNLGALGIVALNQGSASPAWTMSGNSEWNIFVYVVGHFSETGTSKVTGPVITDTAVVAGTPDHTALPDPPDTAPGGGSSTTSTTWAAVPGSWRQLPNS